MATGGDRARRVTIAPEIVRADASRRHAAGFFDLSCASHPDIRLAVAILHPEIQ